MFTIYASRSKGGAIRARTATSLEKATDLCLDLYRRGYKIHRLVLPNGTEVPPGRVEAAIAAGMWDQREAVGE